jgi:Ser/Thr protein kinase RdoA (MazF antagonist)
VTAPLDSAAFLALPAEAQVRGLTGVARAALALWGSGAQEPLLLKHRENAVFKVTAPDGGPAVLRVHRQGYHSDASLRSELAWMEALRAGGVEAPAPITTAAGDLLARVESDATPGVWQVDMLDWLGGRQLGEIARTGRCPRGSSAMPGTKTVSSATRRCGACSGN